MYAKFVCLGIRIVLFWHNGVFYDSLSLLIAFVEQLFELFGTEPAVQ